MFKEIKAKNDALYLQHDIDKLSEWSERWLLKFHPDKCHVLTLGKTENIPIAYQYEINGVELEHVFIEKDLGVQIDQNLKFEEHMSEKVQTANKMTGLIQRSFNFLDAELFKILYVLFVRLHLEMLASSGRPS